MLLRRGKKSLDPARGQGQRPLAQDVDLGLESAQDMRLVQMVWRRDHYGIHLIELQQILEIGEDIGNSKTLGERAGLGSVIVAQRYELRPFDLREHRQVRELRDCAGTNEAEADVILSGF